jgi:hypothetical protein
MGDCEMVEQHTAGGERGKRMQLVQRDDVCAWLLDYGNGPPVVQAEVDEQPVRRPEPPGVRRLVSAAPRGKGDSASEWAHTSGNAWRTGCILRPDFGRAAILESKVSV